MASWAEQTTETNDPNWINFFNKNPNWPGANQLTTRGYRETNPCSGQSGTLTKDGCEFDARWQLGEAETHI